METFRNITKELNNPTKAKSDWNVLTQGNVGAQGLVAVASTALAVRAMSSSKKKSPPPLKEKAAGEEIASFAQSTAGAVAGGALVLGVGYGLYKWATSEEEKRNE
jgi:hypothetical protein